MFILILSCIFTLEHYVAKRPVIEWVYDDAIEYDKDLKSKIEQVIVDPSYKPPTKCDEDENDATSS